MAKTENKSSTGPAKGLVRLMRTDAEGGFIDVPKKKAEKILALQKKMVIQDYIESDTNGDSGSSEDQTIMGDTEK